MNKLICYELNEVPWRVMDRYLERRPRSNLARLLRDASQITTRTPDSGELHPWSTWPTMHRGVANDVHNIRYINQDLACASGVPPLWSLLARDGVTVGIVGCLQSYPPVRSPHVLFHVPDTFAPGPETIPADYAGFQALNLKLTGENKAVTGGIRPADLLQGLALLRRGVTARTGARLGAHLLKERVNPLHKGLRATMQAHVAFDVFFDALGKWRPDYAAFFSNHVAGMMHRYWKYMFPEDFGYELRPDRRDRFHAGSICRAMDIFDGQLGTLMKFADRQGYHLAIASSMGQQAIDRGEYVPELILDDVSLLAREIGFDRPVRLNLAMQPDVALEFSSEADLQAFAALLPRVVSPDGTRILRVRYAPLGLTLNVSVARNPAVAKQGRLVCDGRQLAPEALGMRLISRDPGTGYHQPEGVLIWSGACRPRASHREVVDSRQFAPTVLDFFGVDRPSYMHPPIRSAAANEPAAATMEDMPLAARAAG